MNVVQEILIEEGYSSSKDLVRDISLLFALQKIEQYRSEGEFFEKKYSMTLKKFDKVLHKEKGMEDFEKEEDLADWGFATHALEWWQKKVKELQSDQAL